MNDLLTFRDIPCPDLLIRTDVAAYNSVTVDFSSSDTWAFTNIVATFNSRNFRTAGKDFEFNVDEEDGAVKSATIKARYRMTDNALANWKSKANPPEEGLF